MRWRGCLLTLLLAAFVLAPAPALAQSPPGSVASVSLARADGSLTADWPAVAGAASYHVTYSTDGGASWHAPVADNRNVIADALTFAADNAKSYIVAVRAGNHAGWGGWTNSPAAGPFTPPFTVPQPPPQPGPVVSVSLARADATVTADWPAVAGAAKYHVSYTTDGGANWHAPVADNRNIPINALTFAADNAKSYIVAVRAGNGAGWGGWTNSPAIGPYTPPPGAPAAPAGLAAAAGDGSLTLSWDDAGDSSITGYEYQVNHNDTSTGNFSGWGAWQGVAGSGAATTSHTVGGLTNGREYRLRLRAVNAAGAGAAGPGADPWFVSATPAPPSLDAVDTTDEGATLVIGSWGQAWYYRQESSGAGGGGGSGEASAQSANGQCQGPVQGNQTSVGGLDPDGQYTYGAYGDAQCGEAIASAQVNTLPAAPAKVAKPTVDPATGGGDVTWTALAQNVTGYQLQYRPCLVNYKSESGGCVWRHSSSSPWQSGWSPWGSACWMDPPRCAGQVDGVSSVYYLNAMRDGVYAQVRVRGVNTGSNGTSHGAWSDASDDFLPNRRSWPAHLKAHDLARTGATLRITHHSGAWYYKQTGKKTYNTTTMAWEDQTTDSTCNTAASEATTPALTGLTTNAVYRYRAYSASTCADANEIARTVFTTPTVTLTAGTVRPVRATLTLAGHTGDWWLKRVWPTAGACTAGESDFSHAVTGLNGASYYAYEAHSNNTCTNQIAYEPFRTSVLVSSFGNANLTYGLAVGTDQGAQRKQASQFTTGPNTGGYTLSWAAFNIRQITGSPGDLVVAVYSDSNNRPNSAVTTLSGTNPTGAGRHTYTCASNCTLSANTKYWLLLESPSSTGNYNNYGWGNSSSGAEVTQPSGNGWSMGQSFEHAYNTWYVNTNRYSRYEIVAVPN